MLLENEMVIDLTARKRYGKIEGLFMGEVVEAGSLLIINRCLYKATRLYKGPEYVQALVKFVRSITTHDEIMEMEKEKERKKRNRKPAGYRETVEEYVQRGGIITKCDPSAACTPYWRE